MSRHRIVNAPELGRRAASPTRWWPTAGRSIWPARSAQGTTLVEQFDDAARRLIVALRAAGGEPDDLVSLQVFVTDVGAYKGALPALAPVWRAHFGRHYPAMGLFGVTRAVRARGADGVDGGGGPGRVTAPATACGVTACSGDAQPFPLELGDRSWWWRSWRRSGSGSAARIGRVAPRAAPERRPFSGDALAERRQAHRTDDPGRLPRAVVRVPGRRRRTPGPTRLRSTRVAGADPQPLAQPVAEPADRRRHHRLDVVAGTGRRKPRGVRYTIGPDWAAITAALAQRPRRQADPRRQPRGRQPGVAGTEARDAGRGDRSGSILGARARQRARALRQLHLVRSRERRHVKGRPKGYDFIRYQGDFAGSAAHCLG